MQNMCFTWRKYPDELKIAWDFRETPHYALAILEDLFGTLASD
jgi:hypothetical protein